MRIAFHSPRARYLDPQLPGGDPVFVNNLLEAFRRRGHQVLTVSDLDARDLWRGRFGALRLLREVFRVRRRVRSFSPEAWLTIEDPPVVRRAHESSDLALQQVSILAV